MKDKTIFFFAVACFTIGILVGVIIGYKPVISPIDGQGFNISSAYALEAADIAYETGRFVANQEWQRAIDSLDCECLKSLKH